MAIKKYHLQPHQYHLIPGIFSIIIFVAKHSIVIGLGEVEAVTQTHISD